MCGFAHEGPPTNATPLKNVLKKAAESALPAIPHDQLFRLLFRTVILHIDRGGEQDDLARRFELHRLMHPSDSATTLCFPPTLQYISARVDMELPPLPHFR